MKIDRELLRRLLELEFNSDLGKLNWRLSTLCFILVAALTISASTFEMVVRVIKVDYSSGTEYLRLVGVFAVGLILCIAVLALLELDKNKRG